MKKSALITGITAGQDGSYLAEFLLEKGYEVHGIKRRASLFNTQRIDHIYQDPHVDDQRFVLHYGDLTDSSNLTRIIQEVQLDEVYNLGTQSHVRSASSRRSTRQTWTDLGRSACWGWRKRRASIRRRRPSFSGWCRRFRRRRPIMLPVIETHG